MLLKFINFSLNLKYHSFVHAIISFLCCVLCVLPSYSTLPSRCKYWATPRKSLRLLLLECSGKGSSRPFKSLFYHSAFHLVCSIFCWPLNCSWWIFYQTKPFNLVLEPLRNLLGGWATDAGMISFCFLFVGIFRRHFILYRVRLSSHLHIQRGSFLLLVVFWEKVLPYFKEFAFFQLIHNLIMAFLLIIRCLCWLVNNKLLSSSIILLWLFGINKVKLQLKKEDFSFSFSL